MNIHSGLVRVNYKSRFGAQVTPTYDGYGNYLGQQSLNVCQ
jgi:hypothetical protein